MNSARKALLASAHSGRSEVALTGLFASKLCSYGVRSVGAQLISLFASKLCSYGARSVGAQLISLFASKLCSYGARPVMTTPD